MTGTGADWRTATDFLDPTEPSDLDTCAREPVHLLPAIQPAGVALVCDGTEIIALSTNLDAVLGPGTGLTVGASLQDLLPVDAEELARSGAVESATINGVDVELRAHHSRTGPLVVEACVVEKISVDAADALQTLIGDIRGAGGLQDLLQHAAESIRTILGFDRVWVYRFDADYNGHIIAESVVDGLESFLDLHFGEGDIPAQARALFLENRVRILRNTSQDSVPIVPAPLPSGAWLDTSDLTLRAVSPIHLTYLRNMGATASASMAIIVDGRLWGLLSGHHYSGPRPLDSTAERVAGLISDLLSMQVAVTAERESTEALVRARDDLATILALVANADSILAGLISADDALLRIAEASGCALRLGGRARALGRVPTSEALDALFDYLDNRSADSNESVIVVEQLSQHLPDLAAEADVAAGALAIRLGTSDGNWLVWLRPERAATLTYGDRSDLHVEADSLSPRNSFAKFVADVRGRCEPWGSAVSVATGLRSSLAATVFQQSEQLARRSASLRIANDELDRFAYVAAHDLKEPLRGIHNYTDLLEEDFGEILRGEGDLYLGAIRRLSSRMSGLVQSLLTYATIGQSDLPHESHALSTLVADATELVRTRLDERQAVVELMTDGLVQGNRLQIVQVLSNLLSNAAKYTAPEVTPRIEIDVVSLDDTVHGWERWPQHQIDTPAPIVIAVRDNGIGVPVDRQLEIFEVFRRLHGPDEFGGGSGAGLTIARRIVERHGGTLWVEPNDSGGSTFYFALAERPLAASSSDE